jgi:hypothetical protein
MRSHFLQHLIATVRNIFVVIFEAIENPSATRRYALAESLDIVFAGHARSAAGASFGRAALLGVSGRCDDDNGQGECGKRDEGFHEDLLEQGGI